MKKLVAAAVIGLAALASGCGSGGANCGGWCSQQITCSRGAYAASADDCIKSCEAQAKTDKTFSAQVDCIAATTDCNWAKCNNLDGGQ